MPLITTTTILCDGCGQEITTDPITYRDSNNNLIYLHSLDHLKDYADVTIQAIATAREQADAEAAAQVIDANTEQVTEQGV